MEPNCVSYNFNRDARKCELNNSTSRDGKKKMETNPDYIYVAKNACENKPCKNKATCQTGFTGKDYRCLCTMGFDGDHCENDIDECAKNTRGDTCDANAYCNNTKGGYNCTCHPGYYGDGKNCEPGDERRQTRVSCEQNALPVCCRNKQRNFTTYHASCSRNTQRGDEVRSNESKAYPLVLGDDAFDIYCKMTPFHTGNDACGGGGWTLVMKINGTKVYPFQHSPLAIFYIVGDHVVKKMKETKLPSYWNTSFSKICLGMKIENLFKFIAINRDANSLYS
ncbi:unnamed protein product [Porites lobata]|uniref:EGF-like domain-containing protein n=1 Tax=Porites lobata TaxID=104759 RepID=A0ABN8NJ93_9CNID|nr:unnamed protein product [Porites lobata]